SVAAGETSRTLRYVHDLTPRQPLTRVVRPIVGFNRNMRHLCGVVLLSVLLTISSNAQSSGRISGAVIDSTGAAVGGADVELYLAGGQKPLLVSKTSAEGIYNFIGVRPAEYDLTVSARGFLKSVHRGITVDMARETDIPRIKLELASMTQ